MMYLWYGMENRPQINRYVHAYMKGARQMVAAHRRGFSKESLTGANARRNGPATTTIVNPIRISPYNQLSFLSMHTHNSKVVATM